MARPPISAPCGSWRSVLSAAQVANQSLRLMQPTIAGGWNYWIEGRPAENGRCVLMRAQPDAAPEELTPAPYSVRSRAHEYGGGAYAIGEQEAWFVNDSDQQIYCLPLTSGAPRSLTVAADCRFADLTLDRRRSRLVCVCENHGVEQREPQNSLVSVAWRDGAVTTLAGGEDFYSSPALRPDGGQLAWLAWNHPRMPWEGCTLWLAELDAAGAPQNPRRIAGGPQESIFQPQYAPDGVLYFISDRSGFWNIYRYADGHTEAVAPAPMDYGFPQWNFGMSAYGFLSAQELLAARCCEGRWQLERIHMASGERAVLHQPYTQIEHLQVRDGRVIMLAAHAGAGPAILSGDGEEFRVLRRSTELALEPECISAAQAVSFETGGGDTAHAWYYPPRNPGYRIPDGERPPLMVKCHGGPTAMNGDALEPRIQYWTSRGFAVLDVNYRGSSGYGRAYRERLRGRWGVVDVEDCLAAARHLVARGLADPARLIVSGASAGGFTALACLAGHDFFRAGAVYYGLSDLETAMRDTHKFEAGYGDSLLGPWPESRPVYRARSPLYAAEQIRAPVIFFQGLRDRVVPPDQTARMAAALAAQHVPVACLTFPEEGHGFRRAATLTRTLEAELGFCARVFGFTPAEPLPPLIFEAPARAG